MSTSRILTWQMSLVLSASAVLAACGRTEQAQSEVLPTVEAVTVQTQSFALSSELPGRIEPMRVAEVRARVAGIVLSRNFEEGADVRAGQVLFQIDPAPFRAALLQAQGELARAEAALVQARAVYERYVPLVEIEAVSKQDFDAARATFRASEAARQSALASVEKARLELGYATVRAPISGRIGRALVTEGALVGQGEATPLATIQQLDPIYADFRQPIADVLRLRAALIEGKVASGQAKSAPITVSIEGTNERREGRLLFSDITVDRGTGQVALRGQFANPDGLLLPGMYVRVHISQATDSAAILIPQRAVQRSTDGTPFVLVVGEGDVVESRPVSTGTMSESLWHIVDGLKPGERVVVGGISGARPGTKVMVEAPAPASAANTTEPGGVRG